MDHRRCTPPLHSNFISPFPLLALADIGHRCARGWRGRDWAATPRPSETKWSTARPCSRSATPSWPAVSASRWATAAGSCASPQPHASKTSPSQTNHNHTFSNRSHYTNNCTFSLSDGNSIHVNKAHTSSNDSENEKENEKSRSESESGGKGRSESEGRRTHVSPVRCRRKRTHCWRSSSSSSPASRPEK